MTAEQLLAGARRVTQHPEPDERDAATVAGRMAVADRAVGPRVGDWVRFDDGEERRLTHLWPDTAQTADGPGDRGSFYLGRYGCSYSGSLDHGVPLDALRPTGERKPGRVWIFHHNNARAHNDVMFWPEFRVYACEGAAR